jgi:hypothetical protein
MTAAGGHGVQISFASVITRMRVPHRAYLALRHPSEKRFPQLIERSVCILNTDGVISKPPVYDIPPPPLTRR